MVGIIGAMEEEVAGLKKHMRGIREEERAGMRFFCGELEGKNCVVVCSGIGKVNAAACAQILVDCYAADYIMNTGIAGGLKPEINIGDIVLSIDAVQHDFDCTGFGYPQGKIPRMKTSAFCADEGLLSLAERCCREVNPELGVFQGRVASGDCFVSSIERRKGITETFGASCCEMEGAAIAQVAYLNEIPWLIIRAISDRADGTAAAQYEHFQDEAIGHFLRLTLAMLREL
ncbi:MAG: 5'-methylthioadenosine/adenosylhomocysteine nucleosidase [Stomatobaculum sp.]